MLQVTGAPDGTLEAGRKNICKIWSVLWWLFGIAPFPRQRRETTQRLLHMKGRGYLKIKCCYPHSSTRKAKPAIFSRWWKRLNPGVRKVKGIYSAGSIPVLAQPGTGVSASASPCLAPAFLISCLVPAAFPNISKCVSGKQTPFLNWIKIIGKN